MFKISERAAVHEREHAACSSERSAKQLLPGGFARLAGNGEERRTIVIMQHPEGQAALGYGATCDNPLILRLESGVVARGTVTAGNWRPDRQTIAGAARQCRNATQSRTFISAIPLAKGGALFTRSPGTESGPQAEWQLTGTECGKLPVH